MIDIKLRRTVTTPPAGVNLMLFVRKLRMNCAYRLSSLKRDRNKYLSIGSEIIGPSNFTFLFYACRLRVFMQRLMSLMQLKCSLIILNVLFANYAWSIKSLSNVIIISACTPIFSNIVAALLVRFFYFSIVLMRCSRSINRTLMLQQTCSLFTISSASNGFWPLLISLSCFILSMRLWVLLFLLSLFEPPAR